MVIIVTDGNSLHLKACFAEILILEVRYPFCA